MLAWRICGEKHVPSAFSGIGAERAGGRWNHKGSRVVYASTSLSLASLELFVHVEQKLIPDDLYWVTATVPGVASIEDLLIADLPDNWRDYPAPTVLQDIGTQWLREKRSLVLIVPSAVNPEETNLLLNPLHPDIGAIHDVESKPFHFDPRMWQ